VPYEVFIVGLSPLDDGIPVTIELARFIVDFRLATKENTLRAHNPSATGVGQGRQNVKNECVVAVSSGWRVKRSPAAKSPVWILEALLSKDFLLEPIFLLLVVCLLLRL
jgi:hypothetical protein